MQIWFSLSPSMGWVKIFSASLEILTAWRAFQPEPNILLFFVRESSCAHESVRSKHEMWVEALHSTFPLHSPVLAKSLLARASWQGLWIRQVFRWSSSGQAFLGSSLCKIQRKPVQGSSISGLGSKLEAYSIGKTLTWDQGGCIFSLW